MARPVIERLPAKKIRPVNRSRSTISKRKPHPFYLSYLLDSQRLSVSGFFPIQEESTSSFDTIRATCRPFATHQLAFSFATYSRRQKSTRVRRALLEAASKLERAICSRPPVASPNYPYTRWSWKTKTLGKRGTKDGNARREKDDASD